MYALPLKYSTMYFTDLGYETYNGYLDSKHWQKLRKEVWASGVRKECHICKTKRNLLLHHRTYTNLGHERLGRDVILLCKFCHIDVHFDRGVKTPLERRFLVAREMQLYRRKHSILWRIYTMKPSEFFAIISETYGIPERGGG